VNVVTVPYFRFDPADIAAVQAISNWWPDVADSTGGRMVIDMVLSDVVPLERQQVELLRDYCKAAVRFYEDFSSSMADVADGEPAEQGQMMNPDTWALVVENWQQHAIPDHQAVIDLCDRGLLLV
jgi:hypothetical protein